MATDTAHAAHHAHAHPTGLRRFLLSTNHKDIGTLYLYFAVIAGCIGFLLSLGAGLEYGYQPHGYWHLQGVGEVLSGQVWLGRPFHGAFAEGSLAVFHQFLVRQPRLSTTALAPGLGLGYRWTHRSGLLLGGSAGLRWGRTLDDSDLICTRPKYCNSVRQGPYARITVDLGYVF